MAGNERYPDIAEYAFIADSNSTALVSRAGSIDWCCIQRIDSGSCFGRLLDYDQGGYCSIAPRSELQNVVWHNTPTQSPGNREAREIL